MARENVKERLIEFIKQSGLDVKSFEKNAGLANGFVSKTGFNIRRSSIDKILAAFPELNEQWLINGIGNMTANNVNNNFKDTPRQTQPNARLIGDFHETEYEDGSRFRQIGPDMFTMRVELVTERAKAGWLRGFADVEYTEDLPIVEVPVDFFAKGKYLAFEVDGDSMDDDTKRSIPDKSIIVGRELTPDKWKPRLYNHEWPNWIFVHKRDGILVKQIVDQDLEQGWIVHHSLNPNKDLYPDEKILLKDVFKIYNVVKRILP